MSKKTFRPSTLAGATFLVSAASFISYAIGLLRDRIIAINFGTTSETDIYNAAFLIPDLLFNLFIAAALSAAFLPVFSDYLSKDKQKAQEIGNTMLTFASLIIGALALIAGIFMGKIIPAIFNDIPAQMQLEIVLMTRLMLISALFFAISNTVGNILMSYKHFLSYSLSPIFYNFGIILGIILLKEKFGIYSAAIGVITGSFLHCLIRIVDLLKTDFQYRPLLKIRDPAFLKIIKLMVPRSIGLFATQINLYIYALIGIKMIPGALSAFNFARNIQSFAVSLFGIAFATAAFPYMVNRISQNDHQGFSKEVQKGVQRILFFTIPSAVGVILLSEEIISIVLGGGIFQEQSVKLTATLLFFLGISIPIESIVQMISRTFHAKQNTFKPMIINIISMTISALITIFIAPKYGIEWFSISFISGVTVYVLISILNLREVIRRFNLKELIESLFKTIVATSTMALSLYLLKPLVFFASAKITSLSKILIAVLVFFIISYLLKAPELKDFKAVISRKLSKNL